jgi:hypothetical protein
MTQATIRVGICFLDRVDRQISGAKLARSQEDSRSSN